MNRFDYVKYDDKAQKTQAFFKETCGELETILDELVPPNSYGEAARYRALAVTALEEFYAWVGKTIRENQIQRNGVAPLQEERTNG